VLSTEIYGIPVAVLALGAAMLVLLPAVLVYIVSQQTGPQARFRQRLAMVAGNGEHGAKSSSPLRRARQIKSKLEESGQLGTAKASRVEMRLRIERAGLTQSVRSFNLTCAGAAALAALAYLLLFRFPHPVSLAGLGLIATPIVVGVGAPRFLLNVLTGRRQKKFTQVFADAIDVIVRGIRSGLPVGECLNIIARESPEPVRTEFALLVEGQRLGMTLKQALERASMRMPTADMKFFAVVLTLQAQAGGNLGETLAGLATVLRDRKKMADKVKAMSSEARTTASSIGSMPFLLAIILYIINPAYVSLLWTDHRGVIMLVFSVVLMSMGGFIMKKMIAFEI